MASGQWLECQPDGSYELFSQQGETLASGQLPQSLPTVPNGQSTVVLDPYGEPGQHRLRVSLTTQGDPLV